MTDRLATRACEKQRQKMTAELLAELARKRPEPEIEIIDLRALFPRRDEQERVRETW